MIVQPTRNWRPKIQSLNNERTRILNQTKAILFDGGPYDGMPARIQRDRQYAAFEVHSSYAVGWVPFEFTVPEEADRFYAFYEPSKDRHKKEWRFIRIFAYRRVREEGGYPEAFEEV